MKKSAFFLGRKNQSLFDTNIKIKEMGKCLLSYIEQLNKTDNLIINLSCDQHSFFDDCPDLCNCYCVSQVVVFSFQYNDSGSK